MVHRDSLYSEVVVVPRSRGVARKCEELVERAVARSSVSSLVSSFLFFQRRTADIRLRPLRRDPDRGRAWHRIVHAPEGRGTPKSPPKPATSHLHTSRLTTLATTWWPFCMVWMANTSATTGATTSRTSIGSIGTAGRRRVDRARARVKVSPVKRSAHRLPPAVAAARERIVAVIGRSAVA